MEIQSLHVTNLRTFRGNHTFDFSPRKGPIILIGGKNGSGKTTLMEAVKLCLYGQSAFPRRISRAKYEQQLGQRIHNNRDATVSLNNAAVKLDFTHFRNGSLEHYQVTRSWQKNGSSVKEQLRIDLNGKLMMGLPQERWQDFLHDLVPSGLTELFFFDGERIQALAEDIAEESPTNERHIGVAIKQLLSLDVVEKLQTDLDIYAYRQRKDGTGDDESPLEQLIAERGALQERLENLHAERAQTQTKLDAAAGEMERAERAFALGPEFMSAFPIAGRDGTLEERASGSAEQIRAKTGLLKNQGVLSLSGMARRGDGQEFFFSVLVNGFGGNPKAAMDALDRWLEVLIATP